MPNYHRLRVPGGTYFFTLNLLNRRLNLLTDFIHLLRAAFDKVRRKHPFHIDAIVILPDHLHAIITLPPGDDDYSTRWSLTKAAFSRSIRRGESVSRSRQRKRERGIWQRRFWEHTIRDQDDFNAHVDYIHYNPVKHGYVDSPIDWPFSSFQDYVAAGILDPAWSASRETRDLYRD